MMSGFDKLAIRLLHPLKRRCWKKTSYGTYICSICNVPAEDGSLTPFCPNCGAEIENPFTGKIYLDETSWIEEKKASDIWFSLGRSNR